MKNLFGFRAAARYVGSALAAAAACAALFSTPAFSRGTNIFDNVSYSTLMWSLNDPFGFDTLDLLSVTATNHAARITYLEALGPGGGVEEDPVAYPISTNALAIAGAAKSTADAALPKVSTNGWEYGPHTSLLPKTATNGAEWASHTTLLPKTATNGWETGAHLAWLTAVPSQSYTIITNAPWLLPASTNGWQVGAHQPWLLSVPSQPYTIITNAPWALPSITNGMEYSAHQAWLLAGATNGLASTNYVNAMVSGVDLTRLLDVGNTGYVSHDGTDLSLFASTAYGTFTVVCSNVWNQSLVSPPWGMNGTVTLTASSTGASTNSGLWELSINGLYNYAGYSYLRYNGVDIWSDNRYPLNFPITMTPTAGDNGAVTITRSYPVSAIKVFASKDEVAAATNEAYQALGPGETRVGSGALIGDSTIAAWAGGTAIASLLLYPGDALIGNTISNLAVGGHTIAQQQAVWTACGVKDQFDWIGVQIGLNDTDPAEAASVALARYQTLINTIAATKKPSATIYVATMNPCYARMVAAWGASAGTCYTKWQAMNLAIMGGGATPITNVFYRTDQHTAILNDGVGNLLPAFDTGDGIHPNTAARTVVAASHRMALNRFGYLTGASPTWSRDVAMSSVTNTATGCATFGSVTAGKFVGSSLWLGTLSITNSTLNGTNGVRLNWGSITNYWILGGN